MTSFYHREDEFPTKYSLASLRLGAYLAKQKDIITNILTFHIDDPVEDIVKAISDTDFEFLGLSSYMWTSPKVQEIINKLKIEDTKQKIIVGGPDVENISDDKNILKIKGEGEIPLYETFSSNKEVDLEPSNTIPLYGKEMFDLLSITPEDLGNKFAYYETNRGCLYSCGYCGHKTREKIYGFSNLLIKEEVINIGKLNLEEVFIVDPILGGTKERGKDVLRLFIKFAPNTKLTIYLRPEFVDDEYIAILEQSSLTELRVGIQTINESVPSWVRSNNINQIKNSLTKLSNTNIPWRTELIAGLPGDTFDGLSNSLDFVINELQPTYSYTYPLTVIEGTKINTILDKEDEEVRIKKNIKNQAIESYSYTPEDLLKMIKYSTSINSLYMYIFEKKGVKLRRESLEEILETEDCFKDNEFIKMCEISDYKGVKQFLISKYDICQKSFI